jgi:hypothetical protein
MIDYTLILSRKYPNARWTLNGDDYEGLTWHSKSQKPSQEELDALWPDVLEELKNEKQEALAKKASAEAKLAALGLDADDLKALGLG